MAELEKTYSADRIEAEIYAKWEAADSFSIKKNPDGHPYTIVIPPPNVTGSLHMGHALNNTLQDILIRWRRMKGGNVLWQVGTDHAGIATQMVVERMLDADGVKRTDLGREEFVERVWEWKEESGGAIIGQLRRLGASADWSRERFTMDEGLSAAVLKVFVELHEKGLIYRDKRLVNWDPKLQTAISDLEVEQREQKGRMWYFKYPVEGEEGVYLTVGTTRPETMLGDTGVAVHPDDERYEHLVGKHCVLPLVGRRIPIVADEYADPEKGSGAVKMTPAHDFNDFEVGKRRNLDMVNVLTATAAMNENAPRKYRGMDRYAARKAVVADMRELGFLEKTEDNDMSIPYGDRSGVVIEPWLMDQWFVDAKTLAKPAIAAVENGDTVFVPKSWENTYFEWMRNIQPWCISRQLWWGHQIPAWFGPDGEIFVALTEQEAQAKADAHYGETRKLTRDPDVLDTWFSSALWPFSTLGWPDETPELAKHYPTSVLITGFDIIFFWVARMMMFGMEFMREAPFKDVYIHALVRDEKGQKMSKSKGNVIDPLELIEKYGADALRFTLTAFAAQGRDIKLAESRVEGYRNFCTKIWNAARFCQMNGCEPVAGFDPASVTLTLNKWIVGKVVEAERATTTALETYKFNEAAGALYQFSWNTFCDWYVEFAKPILQGGGEAAKPETRATAAWALDQIITLLHPIMPFITEELWRARAPRGGMLISSSWPSYDPALIDDTVNAEMDWVVRLITTVRAVRSEINVPPSAKIPLTLKDASAEHAAMLKTHKELILRLARLESAEASQDIPKGAVQDVLDEATLVLHIADVIDLAAERGRLEKEIAKQNAEITRFEKKLGNEKFVANAPEAVVETEREKLTEAQAARTRLEDALERLLRAA